VAEKDLKGSGVFRPASALSLFDRCADHAQKLHMLCGAGCFVTDVARRTVAAAYPAPLFCHGCAMQEKLSQDEDSRCEAAATHLYGLREAYRWNGKYIYYCPLGLVFVASSVSDETGNLTGGVTAGPLVMHMADTLDALPDARMTDRVSALPVFSPAKTGALADTLAAVTSAIAGLPHSRAGSFVYEQEKMLNTLYEVHEQQDDETARGYPIAYEKQLHDLICSRDKSGAQQMLNELLGHVYFASHFDLSVIKTRVIELVVLLSRATIDAGADIREIFQFNRNYIRDIEQFQTLDELSIWLTGIMHEFINYAFDFTQVKHTDVVFKIMEYVKTNYQKKITLDDLARHVYLSRPYLSSLFKEETGESLFAYINKVRVDKAKLLLLDTGVSLLDVAGLCGFEDQSYFTKVFSKTAGVSPKRYRDTRGKTEMVKKG